MLTKAREQSRSGGGGSAVPAPAVEFREICKRFPGGVVANDRISFAIERGTVHALLGTNGAGKTTLMNILYGLIRPDCGQILIHGRPERIHSPRRAIELGIGMVHQHFRLIQSHTVVENIILGLRGMPFFLPTRRAEREIRALSERYGLAVDPRAKVWQLSAGEQQRVEILKALYRGAEILILDEPTSVLTPSEVDELLATLRAMAAQGHTIIFITHKLDEALRVADRLTVLRDGRAVGTLPAEEATPEGLARMMVGRDPDQLGSTLRLHRHREPIEDGLKSRSSASATGAEVLVVEDLWALGDMGVPALRGVSFTLAAGEILGIAGVAGNGQRELAEVICGLRPAKRGRVVICGQEVINISANASAGRRSGKSRCSPRRIAELGVAHIPEDRRLGLVDSLGIDANLILKSYHRPPLSRGILGLIDWGAAERNARRLIAEYGIVAPGPRTPIAALSGGNRQRVLLARELSSKPRLIIAAHPTYGLDVEATEQIRRLLREERARGAAILLISEDLDELLSLSDRVLVLFSGRVMGELRLDGADPAVVRERIGLLMAGVASAGSAGAR